MDKAFDIKDLVKKCADGGLDLSEDLAVHAVKSVLSWVEESVVITPNKIDDFALVAIPLVQPLVLKQLDKIDGKVG